MAKYRQGRIRQEIMREVNNMLLLEIKDPRIEGVTITDVSITGDLQHATIYYSTLADKAGARQKTERGLAAVTGKIRSALGKKLSLYKTPEIKFERDLSVDYGSHIDALLNKIKAKDAVEDEEYDDYEDDELIDDEEDIEEEK